MQKYIYGKVGAAGFTYVSSDRDFFHDANGGKRIAALAPLRRTTLTRNLWMVTTNLGIAGDAERTIVQVSVPDPFRGGLYLAGYMTGPGETTFGPEMLRLLKVKFQSLEEARAEAERGAVHAVSREELPVDDIQPAPTDKNLMQNILLALLSGRRVVLRLSETGAARALLLAIYQRLPYECRRLNGFVTGATEAMLQDLENPLPPSITVVLMDSDAETSALSSGSFQQFIDLKGGRAGPIDREKNAAYVRLLDFLAEKPPEELDSYFRFCKSFSDAEGKTGGLTLPEYALLLDMFDVDGEITPLRIRMWAAGLYENRWKEETRASFYRRIGKAIPPETMVDYLTALADFDQLHSLGHLGEEDKNRFMAYRAGRGEAPDPNGALTFAMAEALLAGGVYPPEAGAAIRSGLCRRFRALAYEKHPCLAEKNPTGETLKQLDRLDLPSIKEPKGHETICNAVRRLVYQSLGEDRQRIRADYQRQYAEQEKTGRELIDSWKAGELDALYGKLRALYLHQELLDGWNRQIAEKIAASTCPLPRTLENIQLAVDRAEKSRELFLENGGKFTPAQTKTLQSVIDGWKNILGLKQAKCSTVSEMLALLQKIAAADLAPETAAGLQETFGDMTAGHRPSAEEICSAAPKLISRAGRSDAEAALFRRVLEASDLDVIPEDMKPNQIETRLKTILRLEEAGLTDGQVSFRPWQQTGAAQTLLDSLGELRGYREGSAPPALRNKAVRTWAAENLGQNTQLLLLLAREDPSLQADLIRTLAQRDEAVDAGQILALYAAGCPEELLRQGAGEATAPSWKKAVDEALPPWRELEKPEKPASPRPPKLLLLAGPALLGLAALVVPAVLALTGEAGPMGCGLGAAALAAAGIGCGVCGLLIREKAQKRLLMGLALSLLPGFAALLTQLALALLQIPR